MSQRIELGNEAEWCKYETKQFRAAIVDDAGTPVVLTGVTLECQYSSSQSSSTLLSKTGGAFTLGTTTVANDTAIWTVTDTESGVTLPAGWLWMELWDRSNDRRLVHGGILLQPGRAPI
jgi:hypothetical protein